MAEIYTDGEFNNVVCNCYIDSKLVEISYLNYSEMEYFFYVIDKKQFVKVNDSFITRMHKVYMECIKSVIDSVKLEYTYLLDQLYSVTQMINHDIDNEFKINLKTFDYGKI